MSIDRISPGLPLAAGPTKGDDQSGGNATPRWARKRYTVDTKSRSTGFTGMVVCCADIGVDFV